jgi:hypothetical protein
MVCPLDKMGIPLFHVSRPVSYNRSLMAELWAMGLGNNHPEKGVRQSRGMVLATEILEMKKVHATFPLKVPGSWALVTGKSVANECRSPVLGLGHRVLDGQ